MNSEPEYPAFLLSGIWAMTVGVFLFYTKNVSVIIGVLLIVSVVGIVALSLTIDRMRNERKDN